MARILDALKAAPSTGKHRVPTGLAININWFLRYAETTNGLILLHPPPAQLWIIECDSTLTGGGAYSPTHYITEGYPHSFTEKNYNIN